MVFFEKNKMYYFFAQIDINDPIEYQKYIDGAGDIFHKYSGQYLAVDNNPVVLEGEWKYSRAVIIQFPSQQEFKNWYYSDEYQDILKFRLSGAKCDTILVSGKE